MKLHSFEILFKYQNSYQMMDAGEKISSIRVSTGILDRSTSASELSVSNCITHPDEVMSSTHSSAHSSIPCKVENSECHQQAQANTHLSFIFIHTLLPSLISHYRI